MTSKKIFPFKSTLATGQEGLDSWLPPSLRLGSSIFVYKLQTTYCDFKRKLTLFTNTNAQ